MSTRTTALPLAVAALLAAAGCQAPKGRCDAAADCSAGETCDSGVCVRLPPVVGNGSGGGVDPTTFTPVLWSTLASAVGATFSVNALGADAATGDLYVAGAVGGAFDPWTLATGGFAARLDGGAGALAWAIPFPSFSHGALRTAVATGGDLLFAGTAFDPTSIGTWAFTPPVAGSLVVGRLDALGNPLWVRAIDASGTTPLVPVALAARGDELVLAGTGAGDFGQGDTASASFVAALSGADGSCLWSRGLSTRTVSDLVARDSGEVALAGLCTPVGASFDMGGGVICTKGLFLTVLSADGSTTVWARTSSGAGTVTAVRSVAVSPDGSATVIGDAKGVVGFGGGAAVDFGSAEGSFAAIFGPAGAPGLVVRPVEAPYAPLPDAASFVRGAYDRNGKLWLAGRYYGQPTLGGLRFSPCRDPSCATASFLARLEPNGSVSSFLPIRAAGATDGAAWVDDLVLFATTGAVGHALQLTGAATVGGTAWPTGADGLGVLKLLP
jgi:hypothetical protein